MLCEVIAAGMKEPPRGRERVHTGPEVPFEPIAGGAAVDQIVQIILAASRTRSEMVDFEFATGLGFMNTTVTATCAILPTHQRATPLLIHRRLMSGLCRALERALVFGAQYKALLGQSIELHFGTGKKIRIAFSQGGEHSVPRLYLTQGDLEILLLTLEPAQARPQRRPFSLLQIKEQQV